MKARHSVILMLLAGISCLTILLTACSTRGQAARSIDLAAGVKAAEWPKEAAAPDSAMTGTINRFSAELWQACANNEGNLLISPVSVYLAIAMTANGADGETRSELLQVLAGKDSTLDQLNQAGRSLLINLASADNQVDVTIANSIWYRNEFVPFQPFLQANEDYFRASAKRLDFASSAAADAINSWVKEATHGMIAKIVDRISPKDMMYLINAVYFKAAWALPFETDATKGDIFHAPAGDIVAEFMCREYGFNELILNQAKGVALPYVNGQFVYFALLPDEGTTPRQWLAAQDPAELFANLASLIEKPNILNVGLFLPKYESAFENDLKDELSTLGIQDAFATGQADFSLMSDNHARDLFISGVSHKAMIRVSEEGTEAAAVTGVTIAGAAHPQGDVLRFDRPFIYGILDTRTGTPLFVGILEDPSKAG
jgi:serine protease inhibitor